MQQQTQQQQEGGGGADSKNKNMSEGYSLNNRVHSLCTGNMDELDKMTANNEEEMGVEQQLRGPPPDVEEQVEELMDGNVNNDKAAALENGEGANGGHPPSSGRESQKAISFSDSTKSNPPEEQRKQLQAEVAAKEAQAEEEESVQPNCWEMFMESMMAHVPTKSRKEGAFVFVSGSLLAFNAGFANGATMSELLHYTGASALVSGYAGSYTKSAIYAAEGDFDQFWFFTCLILSYMFGNFLVGVIIPKPVPYRLCAVYGPTFIIGAIFELTAAILAAIEIDNPNYIFFFACAAAGIQNGIASSYSANLIRCAATGGSTDFALYLGNVLRGNKKVLWRFVILTSILINFWIGGFAAYMAVQRIGPYTLFVNAALFWIIGLGLVYFLVHELGVTIQAATIGTWKWDQTVSALSDRLAQDDMDMMDLFDEIDDDKSGEITPDELFEYLLKHEIEISAKEIRLLMKFADENGDGVIDRNEWVVIVKKLKARQATPSAFKLSSNSK